YHGILIRSATAMNAELIGRAGRLRVIGRAGVGVDNVDVEAATRRGIVVANAPQSNVVTAAEHTMALLLALARNIPQAHMSRTRTSSPSTCPRRPIPKDCSTRARSRRCARAYASSTWPAAG